jgi:hypothetical protein
VLKRAVELAAEAARVRLSSWRHCGMRRGVSETSPKILRSRPRYVMDGDYACRTGGIQALPGEGEQALPWLRRGVEVGNHKHAWFQKDKNDDGVRGNVWSFETSARLEHRPSRRNGIPRTALGTCGVVTPCPSSLLAPPNGYKARPLSLQLPPSLRAQSQDVGRHLRLPVARAGRVWFLTPLGRRRGAAQ